MPPPSSEHEKVYSQIKWFANRKTVAAFVTFLSAIAITSGLNPF